MKVPQLYCTAVLATVPALAIFANFSTNPLGGNWTAGPDITATTCYNIGPETQFMIKIDSTPNKAQAGKYCMYMSAGSDCLCKTETFEIDLTKDGDWTGSKKLPWEHKNSVRFLRESCDETILAEMVKPAFHS